LDPWGNDSMGWVFWEDWGCGVGFARNQGDSRRASPACQRQGKRSLPESRSGRVGEFDVGWDM
jgi:hypothetical protein